MKNFGFETAAVWISAFLVGFLIFVILIEFLKVEDSKFYWDAPNPEFQNELEKQDPPEKFADTTHLTTHTKILNDGPTRQKSFIGRPPSLYGPRVYRTLAQN